VPIYVHFLEKHFDQSGRSHRPEGSLVGLCTQDYKSLCASAAICASMVDIQTHRRTDNILINLYE